MMRIRLLFGALWIAYDAKLLLADNKVTDQTSLRWDHIAEGTFSHVEAQF